MHDFLNDDGSAGGPSLSPGSDFLRRVRRSGNSVLGDSETGRQVRVLCDEHEQARQLITQDRSAGALVLAVVGATGQGKSWLVRQMIQGSAAQTSIRSGNNLDQSTEELVWVGSQQPADLDARFERFIRVPADEMQPMGMPYLLVDAPGATDDRQGIVVVAKRALSLASALLLVVRRDQIRGRTPATLAIASEGTIVLPVISATPVQDEAFDADVDAFLANLRSAAPNSVIARPIVVEDFQVSERDENVVGSETATEVVRRLKTELENNPDSDRRKSKRLEALDGRFRAALSGLLADELPGLTRAVNRLNEEAIKLPGEVAATLIGSEGPMLAAVRSRLRLKMLTSTGAIWFPYRTMLALFNLTHGAWDRLLLSLSGSLPSLVSTIWTSTKALTTDNNASQEMRDGLQRRSAAAVSDRLGPLAFQFRQELAILRASSDDPAADGNDRSKLPPAQGNQGSLASMAGVDALQEKSQAIFEDAIEQHAISDGASTTMALIGTLIFWALMAGPFVALYTEYLSASYDTLAGGSANLKHFPKPEFATVLTSFALSLLPTAIFAMIALSIAQSTSRVNSAAKWIRNGHDDAIEDLQRNRVLRLRWEDSLLSDAEFLVSAGSSR